MARMRMTSAIGSAAAATVLAMAAPTAFAQENFTWNGGSGTGEDWELSTNWTGGDGFVSQYPGDAAVDNANLGVALGGNLDVLIDAKSITLGTLTLGATDGAFSTTINGAGGLTLTASNIFTGGFTGATNTIGIDLAMPAGNTSTLLIQENGTNALTLNGSLINAAPGGGSGDVRFVRNDSGQTLTLNGGVILSDTAGNVGRLLFRNLNSTDVTAINGVVEDGAQSGGQLRFANGTYHLTGANTYSGTTQLGQNNPSGPVNVLINTDTAFGTGTVNPTGGGNTVSTIEGATGLGTRTLANEFQLSRALRFAGNESFVLNGLVAQSNSTSLTNDISAAGKTLTINGNVLAANSSDSRTFTFQGSGTTIVNGVIDDVPGGGFFTGTGSVRHDGTGRTIFTHAGVVAYDGNTEVFDGTLQLGTGGVPVNVPATVLGGGTTTTGTLEINHNGAMSLDATPTYQVGIRHAGPGMTTLSQTSFATAGTVNVDAGTLLINGGDVASHVVDSATKFNGKTLTVDSTAGLVVGQPLAVSADNGGGLTMQPGTYITAILNATQVAVNNTMGGPSMSATNEVTFSAGTGTGSSNVIVAAGATVGGNGTIGGLLGVNGTVAPGESIGTLTANGTAIINGTLLAEYDATGAGSSDLLDVLGALTLGASSTLDLNQLGLVPADDLAYVIASYGSLSGVFANVVDLPAGYTVDYAFNDGVSSNNIAIAVPEPAGLALLGLAGFGLAARRRRRQACRVGFIPTISSGRRH